MGLQVTVPEAARRLWQTLAGDPSVLGNATTSVVRGSTGICPPGWTGVVRLGDAYVIEAGEADDATIGILYSLDDPSDTAQITEALQPVRTLGPAQLCYLPNGSDPLTPAFTAQVLEVAIESIGGWLDSLPSADVAESSVSEMERVLVCLSGPDLLGAAGHRGWPAEIGHVGVLVAPDVRGKGIGTDLGAAATRRVLQLGRFPQWRAATCNEASRRAARRIGYQEMGRQFSFRLA